MSFDDSAKDLDISGYDLSAEYYDFFANNIDIPFYVKYAKKEGSPILDIAAGTGRVSIQLARVGCDVVALERSPAMIRVFKKKLENESDTIINRITIVQSEMKEFSLNQEFSMAIVPNSFGHAYTTEAQLSLLKCVYSHLRPSGLFILDLFNGGVQPERASFEELPVQIDSKRTVSRSGVIKSNYSEQRLYLDLTFTIRDIETGAILDEIKEKSSVALIFNREAELLVRLSNFTIEEEFGDFNERPFDYESGRRILMLRKQE